LLDFFINLPQTDTDKFFSPDDIVGRKTVSPSGKQLIHKNLKFNI